jgi:uncharacterized membrane protein (UPF0136 family)
MSKPKETSKKEGITPGLAILGCQASGFLALIGGLMGLIRADPGGAGVCLIAAALAFGIVAYISFTD